MTERDISPPSGEIYQRLLLQQILSNQSVMLAEQTRQGKDIAALKVKAGIWGTIGGAVVTGAYVLQAYIRGLARG